MWKSCDLIINVLFFCYVTAFVINIAMFINRRNPNTSTKDAYEQPSCVIWFSWLSNKNYKASREKRENLAEGSNVYKITKVLLHDSIYGTLGWNWSKLTANENQNLTRGRKFTCTKPIWIIRYTTMVISPVSKSNALKIDWHDLTYVPCWSIHNDVDINIVSVEIRTHSEQIKKAASRITQTHLREKFSLLTTKLPRQYWEKSS